MRTLTKKALKDIRHRKLRAAFTIIGIALGVMGFSAINIASSQVDTSYQYSTNQASMPDIQIFTKPVDPSLVTILQQQPNVMTAQPQLSESTRWAVSSGHVPITVLGIQDFKNLQINKFELIDGHLPGPNEILMESSNRQLAPVQVGDQITIEALGKPQKLTVSGLVRSQGRPASGLFQVALAYMNLSDEQALFHASGVNTFLFQVKNMGQIDATARQLAMILKAHHVLIVNATVGPDIMMQGQQGADGIFNLLRIISIGAIVLSIFLLISAIVSTLAEQVPIIGAMKAIGVRRRQVMGSYLLTVFIYGVVGTILGLGLGIVVGYLLVNFWANVLTFDIGSLTIDPWVVWTSFAIGVGLTLLVAMLPIYFGTRISVQQAISGYGLEHGTGQPGGGWVRLVKRIFGFIPQTIQLGVQSLSRRRIRTFLSLIALSIAGMSFLAVQTTSYSLSQFVNSKLYNSYRADLFVILHNPGPYSQVQAALAHVPGISGVEPRLSTFETTLSGKGILVGMESDTRLYQKQLVAGRWFTDRDQNVAVISLWTAQQTGLKVGDKTVLQDSLSGATWRIIGIVSDYQVVGIAGGLTIVPLSEALAFKHLPQDYTTNLLIKFSNSNPANIDTMSNRVDDALSRAGFQPTLVPIKLSIQQNENVYTIIYVLLYTVTVILTIVGALGLFNTLAMNVMERQREIGILRSIGSTNLRVAAVFWTESLSLGILAWIIALVLGIPAAYGFIVMLGQYLFQAPFAFDPTSLIWMLLFIVVVASVASVGPVSVASRIRIAPILRYE